jgi:hypothetical protein
MYSTAACFSESGNNFLVFSGQCTEAMVQKVHKISTKKKEKDVLNREKIIKDHVNLAVVEIGRTPLPR